jgi:hypothetical protein
MSDNHPAEDQAPERGDEATSIFRLLLNEFASHPAQLLPPTAEERSARISGLEQAMMDSERRSELTQAVNPGPSINPETILKRLAAIVAFLGFSGAGNTLTGQIWAEVLRSVTRSEQEAILSTYAATTSSPFWELTGPLGVMLRDSALDSGFSLSFFSSLFKKAAGDLGGGQVYTSLQEYCEHHPACALSMLGTICSEFKEEWRDIASILLGTLRTCAHNAPELSDFTRLSDGLRDNPFHHLKAVYFQSWSTTALRRGVTIDEVRTLLEQADAGPEALKNEGICTASRILLSDKNPPDAARFALSWLREHASPTISAEARYMIAHFVAIRDKRGPGEDQTSKESLSDLILRIEPIPVSELGTWGRIGHWLFQLVRADPGEFETLFHELATRDPQGVFEVLRKQQGLKGVHNEMRIRQMMRPVVRLILSSDSPCRQLGLHLFESLALGTIPPEMLASATDHQIRLAFHETRRAALSAMAMTRMLLSLLARAAACDASFQDEVFDELLYEGRNYPGTFLNTMKEQAGDHPLVKKALEQLEEDSAASREAYESGVAAMEVPGHRQASRMWAKRFFSNLGEEVKGQSVLLSMIKHIRIIYGKTHSTFIEGELRPPSGLHEFSESFELPGNAISDPEGRLLRHFEISRQIEMLSQQEQSSRGETDNL